MNSSEVSISHKKHTSEKVNDIPQGAIYWMQSEEIKQSTGSPYGQRPQARLKMGHEVPVPNHSVRSVIFSDGSSRLIEDAVTMKAYNGASRGHYCAWDNINDVWKFSQTNALGFNYVDRVCLEVE